MTKTSERTGLRGIAETCYQKHGKTDQAAQAMLKLLEKEKEAPTNSAQYTKNPFGFCKGYIAGAARRSKASQMQNSK